MVFISGLDWSGDSGDPRKTPGSSPLLVAVVARIPDVEWDCLESARDRARRRRCLPNGYVFRYSDSRPAIRAAFFEAMHDVPVVAHALVVNKRSWPLDYISDTKGDDHITACIVDIARRCPDADVAGQTLLIDYPKNEQAKVQRAKTFISRALQQAGRRSFKSVKPCPDHARNGAIVQVADMIAGALRDGGASDSPPYLVHLSGKIVIV